MHHQRIIPAIIPQSLEHITKSAYTLKDVVSEVQIDIVDGVFVSEKSWPYREENSHIESLTNTLPEGMRHELDLMISEPRDRMSLWLSTAPTRIIIHIESLPDDAAVLEAVLMIQEAKVSAVLSAQNDTPLERILALGDRIDGVQCMGISEIGVQGNPFDERVLARIREIHAAHPELPISVDGSVSVHTLDRLIEAGATRFAVGSAIFNAPDPVAAYLDLESRAHA